MIKSNIFRKFNKIINDQKMFENYTLFSACRLVNICLIS